MDSSVKRSSRQCRLADGTKEYCASGYSYISSEKRRNGRFIRNSIWAEGTGQALGLRVRYVKSSSNLKAKI